MLLKTLDLINISSQNAIGVDLRGKCLEAERTHRRAAQNRSRYCPALRAFARASSRAASISRRIALEESTRPRLPGPHDWPPQRQSISRAALARERGNLPRIYRNQTRPRRADSIDQSGSRATSEVLRRRGN